MPWATPPWIWPSTIIGLMTRPQLVVDHVPEDAHLAGLWVHLDHRGRGTRTRTRPRSGCRDSTAASPASTRREAGGPVRIGELGQPGPSAASFPNA